MVKVRLLAEEEYWGKVYQDIDLVEIKKNTKMVKNGIKKLNTRKA